MQHLSCVEHVLMAVTLITNTFACQYQLIVSLSTPMETVQVAKQISPQSMVFVTQQFHNATTGTSQQCFVQNVSMASFCVMDTATEQLITVPFIHQLISTVSNALIIIS